MNSVFLPAQVVVILRRLANVISTLSISNQYLLQRRGRADDWPEALENEKGANIGDINGAGIPRSPQPLKDVEWARWTKRNTQDFITLTGQLAAIDFSSPTPQDALLKCMCYVLTGSPSDLTPKSR